MTRYAKLSGMSCPLVRPFAVSPTRRFAPLARSLLRFDWSLLGMMLTIKGLVFLLGVVAFEMVGEQYLDWPRGVIEIWNRWDAPHYIDLARYGYEATGERSYWIVFYPLFPWLTRLFSPTGDYVLGAIIVSTIASLAAGLLLHRLVRLDLGDELARRAVWFLYIYPTAYFLHIGYTEALFLALTLATFLAARHDRWYLAGVLGAFACLSRINGLILVPCLGLEILLRLWRTRRWDWRWLAVGIIPLGFVGYLVLNYRVTGDPFTYAHLLEEKWFKSPGSPIAGIAEMVRSASWRSPIEREMVVFHQVFFLLLGAVAAVGAWWKLRASYGLWIVLNLGLMTSTGFILSAPRYTLSLFPIPILFALLARKQGWSNAITVWSLFLQALYIALFVVAWSAY
ncbi:MAG: mannosyltransferase family protein [Thermomicrobiales bacterium]